ncbi:hypothetical protein [Paraliomyxa miuraensis]|uniref:hypothetical protein n=1 Tax=Paraliomyxa miuraensis TaxID=376150 RepID=UPI00224C8863|nr:hypothetical protein [Paraliomyxa miuraensis]MCX4239496.1 type I restriction enzyme HsdR N-terminal domain-containing protein [Paraliomyxa miuraensis]
MINEATFEAHLGALLGNLFPVTGVQVTHQVHFTVRLGHHDIRADGRKGWEKKGRADVLLTAEVGHVAILELKRPGIDLTDDDRDQGLSYARLLTPMPPLVILSNGTTTKFYKTIDGTPWEQSSIDHEVFAKLITGASAVAAAARDEAIRSLLGANPDVWADFLRTYTIDALAARTGELREFTFPFARGFSVEREVVASVLGKLRKKAPAVVVAGPPLSGKSVVLKQCCEKLATGDLVPLYVDASSARQGPLRLLASVFARNLFTATSPDQVRQWLSTSLRTMHGETRLVLLLDEIVPELNDAWLGDLDELLALGALSPLSIVLALDPNTWKALSVRPGRQTKTELGQHAEVVQLELLSDREFNAATEQLFDATRSQPHFGGQYNIEYREPRVLRVIAGRMPARTLADDGTCIKFPSTTTLGEIDAVWGAFARTNHELVSALRSLARAYLKDIATRASDTELQLASYRAAAMRQDVATELIPSPTLQWLLTHSFLSTRLGAREEVLLLPRHLELFAKAAALELGETISALPDFDEAYKALMRRSELLPLGDIVGAGALRAVADRAPGRFIQLLRQALSDSPNTETIPTGTTLQVSFRGQVLGEIELPEPSTMIGNIHPWMVLAQLAVLPLGESGGKVSLNGWIIATVGSFDGFLRRVQDERWRDMVGFHFHDFPGKGSVPCLNSGVVEPIGNAMIAGFYNRPDEMVMIAKYAIAQDIFQLAWRLNTAAREAKSATDARTAAAAEEVAAQADEYLHEHYPTLLHDVGDAHDPEDSHITDTLLDGGNSNDPPSSID